MKRDLSGAGSVSEGVSLIIGSKSLFLISIEIWPLKSRLSIGPDFFISNLRLNSSIRKKISGLRASPSF